MQTTNPAKIAINSIEFWLYKDKSGAEEKLGAYAMPQSVYSLGLRFGERLRRPLEESYRTVISSWRSHLD